MEIKTKPAPLMYSNTLLLRRYRKKEKRETDERERF
jgi:hypothetical protein